MSVQFTQEALRYDSEAKRLGDSFISCSLVGSTPTAVTLVQMQAGLHLSGGTLPLETERSNRDCHSQNVSCQYLLSHYCRVFGVGIRSLSLKQCDAGSISAPAA